MAPRVGETISPDSLAKRIFCDISDEVKRTPKRPYLMGVLASDDGGSRQYANWTQKTCQRIGVHFHLSQLSPRNVATYIRAINANPSIHGVIVYYPIFGDKRDDAIRQLVAREKDVEGLNRRTLSGLSEITEVPRHLPLDQMIVPCTPRAVSWILQWLDVYDPVRQAGDRLWNREVCIINRSEVVGLPLAQLLAGEGARVYSVDITGVQLFHRVDNPWDIGELHRKDLPDWTLRNALERSPVVISAVPDPAFKVETSYLRRDAICINVAFEKNFSSDIVESVSKFVPRVGSVTIAALLYNLLLGSSGC
ncbi:hypothetical protein BDV25DRAFT_126025 [Aspergillus avenaceus]|uniref:Tetrahydrofolate dehydrogenase/cyclohydrolase catalytic domain-containing protein n=1 Tax=Aspergillus avenaceus TaxID=36643 RepID=A0A5N6UAW2_ASPAV|nr:hypothetical protein BDV25DRAFT_126025 [Aspergillus avenaceus]